MRRIDRVFAALLLALCMAASTANAKPAKPGPAFPSPSPASAATTPPQGCWTPSCTQGESCRILVRPSRMPPSRTTLELRPDNASAVPRSVTWDPVDGDVDLERAVWLPAAATGQWCVTLSSASLRDANAIYMDAAWRLGKSSSVADGMKLGVVGLDMNDNDATKATPNVSTATITLVRAPQTNVNVDWSARLQAHRRVIVPQRRRSFGLEGAVERAAAVVAQLVLDRFEAAGWRVVEAEVVELLKADYPHLSARLQTIGLRSLMRDPASLRAIVVEAALDRLSTGMSVAPTSLLARLLTSPHTEALAYEAVRELQRQTVSFQQQQMPNTQLSLIISDCLRSSGCVAGDLLPVGIDSSVETWFASALQVLQPTSGLVDDTERYHALIRLLVTQPGRGLCDTYKNFVVAWTENQPLKALESVGASNRGIAIILGIAAAVQLDNADDAAKALDSLLEQLTRVGDRQSAWVVGIGSTIGLPLGWHASDGVVSGLTVPVGLTLQRNYWHNTGVHIQLTVLDLGGILQTHFVDGKLANPAVNRVVTPGLQAGFLVGNWHELRILIAADLKLALGKNDDKLAFADAYGVQITGVLGVHLPLVDF